MTKIPTLSVVLAIHNEAENLERCLKPVQEIANELIIVDGESTDDSVAVAKKLGARVISTTNKSNFHINKQMAMDAAQGDLVLQLDADEVVDQELKRFISQLLSKQLPDQPKAWSLKRKNYFFGRFLTKGGQYPDPVIRLYQNGFARLPQKNVHEQMQVDGRTEMADGHLLHYANPDFATYMRKFNTYTSFEAELVHAQLETQHFFLVRYWILKPLNTFFSLFLRHRGYVDGMAGFVFALMSALHHPFVYLKVKEFEVKQR